jgi:competence protein ComGC
LALASLLLGIAGIALCLGPLTGIPAVICGHLAQNRMRAAAGTLTGAGQALAGLITGYIAIALGVVMALLAAMAIPNLVMARKEAQRTACLANLRTLQSAKAVWALEQRQTDEAMPTDADVFGPDKMIREKPVCPAGGIYTLRSVGENPTCSIPGHVVPDRLR